VAAGDRMGVDPMRPRTALGALAAHLVWEDRLRAVRFGVPDAAGDACGPCPLDAYLELSPPGGGEAAEVHRALHRALEESDRKALGRRWSHLVAALREPTPGI